MVGDPEKEICAAMGISKDDVCEGSSSELKVSVMLLLICYLSSVLYQQL